VATAMMYSVKREHFGTTFTRFAPPLNGPTSLFNLGKAVIKRATS